MKCSFIIMAFLLLFVGRASAGDLDEGKRLLSSGDIQGAAAFFNRYANEHPNDSKTTPEALALCGRALDALADSFTGTAEKSCYWSKGGSRTPACMEAQAAALNARFGADAFRYEHAITFIFYTGNHYRKILEKFQRSDYATEAEFYLLLRELIGHPDTVLPRIKSFLSKHSSGEWNQRGLLLWARVNQDIWYVHRKWSWVLFNDQVSPEELIIRAEPYRQEALRSFEKVMRERNTFEGKHAAEEYELLKNNKEDAITYSIVNDSSPGTLSQWGIDAPTPPTESPSPAPSRKKNAEALPPAKPQEVRPETKPETEKTTPSTSPPKRWQ